VWRIVDLLAERGVSLPFPYSSALVKSRYRLRELRVQSKGRPLRISYGFDPMRRAVVLLGADKTGDDDFYDWFIPKSDERWERYLKDAQKGVV
ncbi:MAG: type II toxin-antitoxin system RelE/ParE family toxin, partial [Gemmatimonadales bacterium]